MNQNYSIPTWQAQNITLLFKQQKSEQMCCKLPDLKSLDGSTAATKVKVFDATVWLFMCWDQPVVLVFGPPHGASCWLRFVADPENTREVLRWCDTFLPHLQTPLVCMKTQWAISLSCRGTTAQQVEMMFFPPLARVCRDEVLDKCWLCVQGTISWLIWCDLR